MGSAMPESAGGGGVLSRPWANVAVTFVGYFILTVVGNRMLPTDGIAVLWPATGFAAVMVLWAPTWRWRLVTALAAGAAYLLTTFGEMPFDSAEHGFVVADIVEPLIIAMFLIRATAVDRRLTSLRSGAWLAAGAVVGAAASGTIAALTVWIFGPAVDLGDVWLSWAAGDALGVLVVAPLMLQARPLARLWRRGSVLEQVILWVALAASLLVLIDHPSLAILVLGVVVLIAVRLDTAATSLAIFVAAATMALLAMDAGATGGPTADQWADVRVHMAIVIVAGQAVSLATIERLRALAEREAAVADALGAARRAEESDAALRSALDAALDAFVIVRPDGDDWRVVFANGSARSSSGLSPQAAVGAELADLLPAAALPTIDDLLHRAVRSLGSVPVSASLARASSNWHGTVEIAAARTPDEQVVLTWRDVTEDHAQERKVRAASAAAMHAATHDPLTNLPNGMLFEDRFRSAVGALGRTEDAMAVIVVDVDGFGAILDRYGEAAADAVLIEVAARLRSLVRAHDTVARIGSDEFQLLLTGLDRDWAATDFFDRLTALVGAPIQTPAGEVQVTISAAHLQVTDPTTTPDVVRQRLFATVKHGRSGGPGRITEYSDDLRLPNVWSPSADDIATALRDEQFRLAYQPIVEVRTGDVVGQEALLRWTHPEHGPIGPDQFIGVAESAGLMVDVGAWVLRQALADRVRQPAGTWTSINVSSAQLVRRDLARDVGDALAASGVPSGELVLELVESQLVHASPTTRDRLDALRAQGVRIALDDFGSGYSSLSYLQDFSVDIVKLDRGLIDGPTDGRRLKFLRWLAEFAPTTGVMMIVEGVETPEQRDLALAAGLRLGQGYLWGRPAFLDT